MVKLTMIARVTDGLPLAEGMDDGCDMLDADFYKQQVKALFKNLSRGHNEASRMSVETGPYIFHYIIEGRVCYLTMCDRAYPKSLLFNTLKILRLNSRGVMQIKLKPQQDRMLLLNLIHLYRGLRNCIKTQELKGMFPC